MTVRIRQYWQRLWHALPSHASLGERLLATAGGALAILAILWVTRQVLDQQGAAMIAASMGATAMLLFALPHSLLSQPWSVVGGHVLGALVGVSCARYLGDPLLAAPLAVGLTIGLMYRLRCQHPPGVATSLIAVLGGESVQQLGYAFLLTPVLENTLILLAVAVLFNLPFPWRRYPAGFAAPQTDEGRDMAATDEIPSHDELVYALEQMDSYIDVSEQDLQQIYRLARQYRQDHGVTVPPATPHRPDRQPVPAADTRP